jgi:pentatricopeptide repeat protein
MKGFFTFARTAGTKQIPFSAFAPQRQTPWKAITCENIIDKSDTSHATGSSNVNARSFRTLTSQHVPVSRIASSNDGSFSLFSNSVNSRLFSAGAQQTQAVDVENSKLSQEDPFVSAIKNLKSTLHTTPVDEVDAEIYSFAKRNDMNGVMDRFNRLFESDMEPNVSTFEAVATAITSGGPRDLNLKHLLDFKNKIEATKTELPPPVYSLLISALCQCDQQHSTQQYYSEFDQLSMGNEGSVPARSPEFENLIDSILGLVSTVANKGVSLPFGCYARLLATLSHHGDVDNSTNLFEFMAQMRSRMDAGCYTSIIAACAKKGDVEAGETWFHRYLENMAKLTSQKPMFSVFNEMLGCYARAGNVEKALSFSAEMKNIYGLHLNSAVYSNILFSLFMGKHFDEVEKLFKNFHGNVPMNYSAYQPFYRVLCRKGEVAQAFDLLPEMLKQSLDKGPKFTDLSILFGLSLKSNDFEHALRLCRMFREWNYECSVQEERLHEAVASSGDFNTFKWLLDSEAESVANSTNNSLRVTKLAQLDRLMKKLDSKFEWQMYLARKMIDGGFLLTSSASSLLLSSYKAALNAGKTQNLVDADYLLLAKAISKLSDTLDVSELNPLTESMLSNGVTVTPFFANVCETAFLKAGQPELFQKWSEKYFSQGNVEEALSAIPKNRHEILELAHGMCYRIEEHMKNGRLEAALKAHSTLRSLNPKEHKINLDSKYSTGLIYDLIVSGRTTEALDIVSFAVDTALSPNHVRGVYRIACQKASLARSVQLATHFFDKIKENNGQLDYVSYSRYVGCLMSTKSTDGDRIFELYQEGKGLGFTLDLYLANSMIYYFAQSRRPDLAQKIFDDRRAEKGVIGEPAYNGLLTAYARVGNTKAAMEIFEEYINQPHLNPDIISFNIMMQLAVQTEKNLSAANDLFTMAVHTKKLSPNARTMQLLIEGYATLPPRDLGKATNILSTMRREFRVSPTAQHYASLIEALHDDLPAARQLFENYMNSDIPLRSIAFEAIVKVHSDKGDMKFAQHYRDLMLQRNVSRDTYVENRLIEGFFKAGEQAKAEHLFNQLVINPSFRALPSTYVIMIQGYLRAGDEESANKILKMMRSVGFPFRVIKSLDEYRSQIESGDPNEFKDRIKFDDVNTQKRFVNSKSKLRMNFHKHDKVE